MLLGGGYQRIERFALVKVGLFTLQTMCAAAVLLRPSCTSVVTMIPFQSEKRDDNRARAPIVQKPPIEPAERTKDDDEQTPPSASTRRSPRKRGP